MDIPFLKSTPLFAHMTENDIEDALHCLNGYQKNYCKNELILAAGESILAMGLVLSGSVTIESNDHWGNRTILAHVPKGQYFGETYACFPDTVLPIDVLASEDCSIAFFEISRLPKHTCHAPQVMHQLTANLLQISLQKNMALSNRSFHTAPKIMREKILSYLNTVSLQKHSTSFEIPFDRQQLADYLNLDRTALSKELSKMRKEGLIDFWKNHFQLNTVL